MQTVKSIAALGLILALAAGCNGDSDAPSSDRTAGPLSIVVVGDSIAAGEGINYGYAY